MTLKIIKWSFVAAMSFVLFLVVSITIWFSQYDISQREEDHMPYDHSIVVDFSDAEAADPMDQNYTIDTPSTGNSQSNEPIDFTQSFGEQEPQP